MYNFLTELDWPEIGRRRLLRGGGIPGLPNCPIYTHTTHTHMYIYSAMCRLPYMCGHLGIFYYQWWWYVSWLRKWRRRPRAVAAPRRGPGGPWPSTAGATGSRAFHPRLGVNSPLHARASCALPGSPGKNPQSPAESRRKQSQINVSDSVESVKSLIPGAPARP